MTNQIEPNKEYLPSEIAKNGWILSGWGNRSTRAVLRIIERGKLKAKPYIIFGNKTFKVLGSDVIKYLEELEEKKNLKKSKKKSNHVATQPQ